jgi:hypothetical protein
MTLSIDTLTAYIAVDDDGEGIMAFRGEDGWLPMVGADPDRIAALRPIAEQMAAAAGKRCVVARFSVREDLEIIEPDQVTRDENVEVHLVSDPTKEG